MLQSIDQQPLSGKAGQGIVHPTARGVAAGTKPDGHLVELGGLGARVSRGDGHGPLSLFGLGGHLQLAQGKLQGPSERVGQWPLLVCEEGQHGNDVVAGEDRQRVARPQARPARDLRFLELVAGVQRGDDHREAAVEDAAHEPHTLSVLGRRLLYRQLRRQIGLNGLAERLA